MAKAGVPGLMDVRHLSRGQILDLILDIEERLRCLVREVFQSKRADWQGLIPKTMREHLLRAKTSTAPPGDILDRADLKQLIDLVLARWSLFDELLRDKSKFAVRANEFREWRNRLAHGKNPTADEKLEIGVVLKQLKMQVPALGAAQGPNPLGSGSTVRGTSVLWVDDHPEWTLPERRIITALGASVFPVLTNVEAIELAREQSFDLVISDIDHGDEEPGDVLPQRLRAAGVRTPILFYVSFVDPGRSPPGDAMSITSDPGILIRDALAVLTSRTG